MGIYREYISEDADMQTMLFRYAVIVGVLDSQLPAELRNYKKLSEETKKKLLKEPYSEQNDRLIMLYGMGIVDENTVKNLILFNKSNWLPDTITLENRVRSDEEREIESDYKKLCEVFTVCANSRKYAEITGVDFDTAEKILESPYTEAVNGFIHVDKKLLEFMYNAGFQFGFYDPDSDIIQPDDEYIPQVIADENYDIKSDKFPFPFNYVSLRCCLAVFGKNYASDFMTYANENGIRLDENFEVEYEKYINNVKLCFDIKAYSKKRDICGSHINYFDYAHNIVQNGQLIKSELEFDEACSALVRVDSDEVRTEDELMESALKKYGQNHQPMENMIIEVYHCKKITMYIYLNGKFRQLSDEEEKEFRTQLFDFNEIWGIIKEYSDAGKLRRKGDTIIISSEAVERIRPEWREYIEKIINDQFGRRKRNMFAAALNELRQAAAQRKEKDTDTGAGNGGNGRKTNSDPKNGNGGK